MRRGTLRTNPARIVTSAGADCCAATSHTASEVIVTSKNECVSFLNLSNLFVQFNRPNPKVHALYAAFFLDPTADVTVKNDSTVVFNNALGSFGFQNGSEIYSFSLRQVKDGFFDSRSIPQ